MTPHLREVLIARFIAGESCAEIALRYEGTEQTVSSRVREAIREMKLYFEAPAAASKMNASENSTAFGAPGIEPRWTSSAKEGVGTAYHTSCRLWFTLSHGIINEIYYPRVDRTPATFSF